MERGTYAVGVVGKAADVVLRASAQTTARQETGKLSPTTTLDGQTGQKRLEHCQIYDRETITQSFAAVKDNFSFS
jgi:hypothetical protein